VIEDPELPEEQQRGPGHEADSGRESDSSQGSGAGADPHQGSPREPDSHQGSARQPDSDEDEGAEHSAEDEGDDDGGAEISPAVAALLGDKLYFKIGEVARIVGVKPYVLRYWETEFSILRPGKTRSKHRLYRRRDVDLLLKIKDLLHTRRFTIEGARKKLREESASTDAPSAATGALAEIREALVRIRDSLA
jgi:DNA-binding transcriptional MerR regulator